MFILFPSGHRMTEREGNVDILQKVGNKIKEIRKIRGISQETLGEKAGLSSNYIGQIERGQKQVTLTTLVQIADALEVDISLFFEESEKKREREELALLFASAKTLSPQDIKVLRLLAEHLAKRS